MMNRKELKANAKTAFKRNYWPCVLVALVVAIFAGGTAGTTASQQSGEIENMLNGAPDMTTLIATVIGIAIATIGAIGVGILIDMFITNPLMVGGNRFFIANSSEKASASELLSGYRNGHFGKVFVTMFLTDLYQTLWALLFIVPGIVKFYSYRMVPYLVSEHPEMGANELITMSRKMMNGHKWEAFVLDLSFIGWWLLTAVTCGLLGLFYVQPYYMATCAEFYLKLKENA